MKTLTVTIGIVLLLGLSLFVYRKNAESQRQNTLLTHQYNVALRGVAKLDERRSEEYEQLALLKRRHSGQPEAIMDSSDFDFGIMNPFTEGEHRFVICNEGKGPLHLRKGGKTCHCVGFEVLKSIILPGETGEVLVRWDTKYPTDEFRHGATVITNDEQNPEIKFRVNGVVRTRIGTSSDGFVFDRVLPGRSQSVQQVVFSQIWDDFEILDSKVTMNGAKISFRPARESELLKLKAKSGYVVTVTIPGMQPGSFSGQFAQLKVQPRSNGKSGIQTAKHHTLEIEIRGRVINRLSVYDNATAVRTIKFRDVTSGIGAKKRLFMRVNDEVGELNLTGIVTEPAFVKAEITRLGGSTNGAIYCLDVEIPGDGFAVRNESNPGRIRMSFDHPRITDLELGLTFSVIDKF